VSIEPTTLLNSEEELIWLDTMARLEALGRVAPRIAPALTRYCQLRRLYDKSFRLAAAGPIMEDRTPNPGYAQVGRLTKPLLDLERELGLGGVKAGQYLP